MNASFKIGDKVVQNGKGRPYDEVGTNQDVGVVKEVYLSGEAVGYEVLFAVKDYTLFYWHYELDAAPAPRVRGRHAKPMGTPLSERVINSVYDALNTHEPAGDRVDNIREIVEDYYREAAGLPNIHGQE